MILYTKLPEVLCIFDFSKQPRYKMKSKNPIKNKILSSLVNVLFTAPLD